MVSISVIILTFNEELHIQRCIEKVKTLTDQIFVVDSFSSDRTIQIASSLGAMVVQNKWPGNQAVQFNWALDHLDINTEWILRLDADEYLTDQMITEINERLLKIESPVNGIFLNRKLIFMGRLIKYGVDKVKILRIFRKNTARYSQTWMDEHLVLSGGETITLDSYFVDDNLNTITNWTEKHNDYAIREAINMLDDRLKLLNESNTLTLQQNKKSFYAKMPMFLRGFAYFVYRYIIKLGFLDGKEGFIRHFLQGFWYRTLVDAKLLEIQKACGDDKTKIKEYLKQHYKIEL
ncbi:glycosyltransferase family 2 protein [Pedobacter changchengzhani]|uniref:Glycosyltransferase family 2 protein n=1 Tax=Pedobacter changchengzhani TaxID=2529274 RepID=A0A4R5MPE3_9SPHI|nr:glycosyltransferase family 2 protein [Pedobacter changchengzhani]TDG37720.1 glycosyltransferase family 2 protein [Pedobacter changchengzhani]